MNLVGNMFAGAVLSDCGLYRYKLTRDVHPANELNFGFFGINPSTADATIDDATVRKWRGFSQRNNCQGFAVGNVFGFRATDVKELATCDDPIGPENDEYISKIIERCDVLIPCWGNSSKVPKGLRVHVERLAVKIRESGKPTRCFGLTKNGDPKHPLMLGYDTKLISW